MSKSSEKGEQGSFTAPMLQANNENLAKICRSGLWRRILTACALFFLSLPGLAEAQTTFQELVEKDDPVEPRTKTNEFEAPLPPPLPVARPTQNWSFLLEEYLDDSESESNGQPKRSSNQGLAHADDSLPPLIKPLGDEIRQGIGSALIYPLAPYRLNPKTETAIRTQNQPIQFVELPELEEYPDSASQLIPVETEESDQDNTTPSSFPIPTVENHSSADSLSPKTSNSNSVNQTDIELNPWWDQAILEPQQKESRHWKLTINDLVIYFLKHSPRLKSIQFIAQSSQPAIPENLAEFDPTLFVESNFNRLNDPIGNILTTGNPGRFRDNDWTTRAGLRKKLVTGGSIEAFQRFGLQTNNSEFFIPDQQGTAYLALNFNQPLLNGRGRIYNESLIAIATLENQRADNQAEKNIQNELFKLIELYWQLNNFRAVWLQKKASVARALKVYEQLRGREEFDVSPTQTLRAKSAVETRKADLIQAQNNIRNAESRLSAALGIEINGDRLEYVPAEATTYISPEIEMGDAFVTALSNRPEVLEAGKRVEIAATQANRSRHELLPVLDLLIGTYVSGLNDNYEFANAFGRQFSEGAPGYSAGINFEMPLRRRAAKARLEQRELEWQAITSELETTMLLVQSDVDIAVRRVSIAHQKLIACSTAMEAANKELLALEERLSAFINDVQDTGTTLNFLLDAQDRLAEQENSLANAQAEFRISWIALKKAMGTLVLLESGNLSN